MSRIVRNIFWILFSGVLMFNFIIVALSYNGAGWVDGSLTQYFIPTRDNFIGLEVWFDKIASYPGLKHVLGWVKLGVRASSENPVLTGITYIFLPFELLWQLIVDVINNIIWFFSLIDPYHVFTGF